MLTCAVQVLLVSARDALLARLVLTNKATQRELEKFRTLAFGRRSVPRSQGQMLAAAEEMFADSGLAGLENSIFAFLYSHSAPLKLMSVVDGAARLLHQVGAAGRHTACGVPISCVPSVQCNGVRACRHQMSFL